MLGLEEASAAALGIAPDVAVALQGIAAAQVAAVPEPETWLMFALGGGVLAWMGRRRRASSATTA
jgi:hypothetical protein